MKHFKILFITFIILLTISSSVIATSFSKIQTKGLPNLVINEFLADPASGIDGDANGDGVRDSTDDEFVEIYNNSGAPVNISNWTLSDAVSVRHTFPNGTIIPANCSIVIFGGDTATGAFGFSLVQIANGASEALGLNNGGDTITLASGATPIASVVYGAEGGENQSLTRDPEVTGVLILHSDATNAGGTLFSPGTNADGSNFSGCPIGDLPPTIDSTVPDDQVSEVAVDANITVNFSEDVTMLAGAFELNCEGDIIALTGVPATANSVVLNPVADMPLGKFCTVTAFATSITDLDDGIDQLDGNGDTAGGDNYSWTFITGLPELEIWQIQGDSVASIYAGYNVSSSDNIVTVLNTNGFYMQTPNSRDDNDANTSNGIFVYTGAAPTVSIGDQVDVSGALIEFFGLTEFSFGTVTIDSGNNPLPTAILLDDNFPPNDPTVALCSTNQSTHKYECLESMHFDMPQGFISAGFVGFFGSNRDDVYVRAGTARAFREPGIEAPGLPGLPEFDGNPELLEMDIDSLGLPLTQFTAGTEVAITGVFGFDFNEYEIWPATINIINENIVPGVVRDKTTEEATLASVNLFRLFNDIDDPGPQDDGAVLDTATYQLKLAKLSKYFITDLKAPMIIGLQEVENINALNDLATKITKDGGPAYTAFLTEGNDVGGIDVAFMYQADLLTVNSITQLGATETQSSNGFLLHDRPPLYMDVSINLNGESMNAHVLVVHLRSRGGIEGSDSTRVREKRLEQANSVAAMIADIQTNNPAEAIIALGDFNAFQFTDGYVDVVGQIAGTAIATDNENWTNPLFVANPLTQAIHTLDPVQQYSYIYNGNAQVLDNALLNNQALLYMNEMQFGRGQADVNIANSDDPASSLRATDHDGFVLFLSLQTDIIFVNGFE
ncbi:hypothetical protein MNBD_GAMMA01-1105 [hydrothermal vent metagenome]|uniref:LTD domain-containing protein n=1 Tax=hydrothermal vent metagenome TaxID=652676 RepID=A0A3B0VTD5_9ZZZZ